MLTFVLVSIIGLAVVAIAATPWRRILKLVLIGAILFVAVSVYFYRFVAFGAPHKPRTDYQTLLTQVGAERNLAQQVLDSLLTISRSGPRLDSALSHHLLLSIDSAELSIVSLRDAERRLGDQLTQESTQARDSLGLSGRSPLVQVILYLVMIAGMAVHYFFTVMVRKRKVIVDFWQMVKPAFIAPIVYAVIVSAAGIQSPLILLFALAFQNGFFWQTVLGKTAKEE